MFVQAPKNKQSKKSLETGALTFKNINLLTFVFISVFHTLVYLSRRISESNFAFVLILNKFLTEQDLFQNSRNHSYLRRIYYRDV